jgi:hypothetical protein
LATFVQLILTIDIVWQAAGLFIELHWGSQPSFERVAPQGWGAPQWSAWAYTEFGLISLLLGVVIIFWVLRVARNAYVLKGRPLENSPIFTALWWYVIPFMSLFKPVQSLGEVWDASTINGIRREQNRFMLLVWWIALLAHSGLGSIGRIFQDPGFTAPAVSVIGVIQSVAFAYIVLRITAMQVERHSQPEAATAPSLAGSLESIL